MKSLIALFVTISSIAALADRVNEFSPKYDREKLRTSPSQLELKSRATVAKELQQGTGLQISPSVRDENKAKLDRALAKLSPAVPSENTVNTLAKKGGDFLAFFSNVFSYVPAGLFTGLLVFILGVEFALYCFLIFPKRILPFLERRDFPLTSYMADRLNRSRLDMFIYVNPHNPPSEIQGKTANERLVILKKMAEESRMTAAIVDKDAPIPASREVFTASDKDQIRVFLKQNYFTSTVNDMFGEIFTPEPFVATVTPSGEENKSDIYGTVSGSAVRNIDENSLRMYETLSASAGNNGVPPKNRQLSLVASNGSRKNPVSN